MPGRLERRLDLLPARAHDAPRANAHFTNAIGWSYERGRPERAVSASWGSSWGRTLGAAEQVVSRAGERSTLELPQVLLDSSLVTLVAGDEGGVMTSS